MTQIAEIFTVLGVLITAFVMLIPNLITWHELRKYLSETQTPPLSRNTLAERQRDLAIAKKISIASGIVVFVLIAFLVSRFYLRNDEPSLPPPDENHTIEKDNEAGQSENQEKKPTRNFEANLRLSNGVYTGWVLPYTAIPDGTGEMRFNNGDVYYGEWEEGAITGSGSMLYHNGDGYDGDWLNGQRNGVGVYTWKDGRVYDGAYMYNLRHGIGTFSNWVDEDNGITGTFEGHSIDDNFEGEGKFYFDNGDFFEGEFRKNRRWIGTYKFSDGAIVEIVNGVLCY
jgi:hypothetical protein